MPRMETRCAVCGPLTLTPKPLQREPLGSGLRLNLEGNWTWSGWRLSTMVEMPGLV